MPPAKLDQRFGRLKFYQMLRPVVIGVVHGLAGSAAVALLVLPIIRDPIWAMAYLLVFGVGNHCGNDVDHRRYRVARDLQRSFSVIASSSWDRGRRDQPRVRFVSRLPNRFRRRFVSLGRLIAMKRSRLRGIEIHWLMVAITGILFGLVAAFVDLKPVVDENFFFSTSDPQFRQTKRFEKRFPSHPELIFAVSSQRYFFVAIPRPNPKAHTGDPGRSTLSAQSRA